MSAASAPPPTVELTVTPDPDSVRRVRRTLTSNGLDPDLHHTVSLLTSELVTNAIRHAAQHGPLRVEARFAPDFAHIDVIDSGPGFDPDVRHTARGYGLRLVDKLASRWGVDSHADGTHVWFEVDKRRRRFERA